MSETDPWKVAKSTIRARIADYSVALLGHSSGSQQAKENAQTAIDVAIDAARAAEAAQHQQEIAAKDAMIAQLEENIARQAGYMLAADARLAAVEAERDKAQRALATAYLKARRQASVCEPNEDQFAGAMAVVAAAFPNTRVEATAVRIAKPEEPTELVVAVKRRAERAEAERDRLKAALSKITALDFEKFNGRHNFYSGAVMFVKAWLLAYAALTPHQCQSTDGETR